VQRPTTRRSAHRGCDAMNVLSLFSGVGGFDLGLERAGMKTIYQCELDIRARSILERHWPNVPKWDDVSTLTAEEILRHGQNPDVIAWGSPCQDLSVAGRRAGIEGSRSGLFHEGIRIIKELREATNNEYPRISIWENVPGAITSNDGKDFGVVLDEMAKAGALVIEWAVLDAQHFGVPQRRRRTFVVSIFDPAIAGNCPDPLLPVRKGSRGDSKKGKQKGKRTPSQTQEGFGTTGSGWWLETDQAITLCSRDTKSPSTLIGENLSLAFDEALVRSPNEPLLLDGTRVNDVRIYESPVQTLMARMGTGGNNVPMLLFDTEFGSNATVLEDMAPTLKSSQQAPSVLVSGLNIRKLTPLECERLMGWPDDHTRWNSKGKEQTDTSRYRQCGNGVASPVAEWVGRHVMEAAR
jgi:DNA (cytosine-5)-methyltransferase 1